MLSDLAVLVRAPAALTVPGDAFAGAAAAGRLSARTAATAASSVCLYWAGMALNDYADRHLDILERPERPIPSGRVGARTALTTACALTAAGLGISAWAGGPRALAGAVPLAVSVWAYDLAFKGTRWGPAAMAATRALDVLRAAGPSGLRSALPAAVVACHVHTVTWLSKREESGSSAALPAATLGMTASLALALARVSKAPGRRLPPLAVTAPLAAYLTSFGAAQAQAVRRPTAERIQAAVGAGILGLVPLQAALVGRTGAPKAAALISAVLPLARYLTRRTSPT
ncbi:SCO3242 family prenyltransferase [Streptomyces sp. CC228A]|uniref:SCO3242 family prenyltransferase n=1 Tax=Streptomyces sp. CC228A TaxID=2898186 RepID=UPI001F3BF541|nr:UbiA family prenyltransferase [Streptomyces sp. CC228A]